MQIKNRVFINVLFTFITMFCNIFLIKTLGFFFKAAKGILTAGPRKAVKYAGAKLKKMMKSQLKS